MAKSKGGAMCRPISKIKAAADGRGWRFVVVWRSGALGKSVGLWQTAARAVAAGRRAFCGMY